MGRSMLIVVLLTSTLYAGIMMSMQRSLFSLPDIVSRNMLQKQAESVSDYALRTAVRNSVSLGMQASPASVTQWTVRYTNFNVQNCKIDSIKYSFVETANRYRAQSYVRGSLMGRTIQYPAELAFNFPLIHIVGNPNCFYMEMNQPQFNPSEHFNQVDDSSPNENDGLFYGDVTTRPMGQGVDGWKCASFGSAGGWITHPGNASMQVNSNFSVVSFAKIRAGHPAATIIWLASDPFDKNTPYTDVNGVYHPGQNLRFKPTLGIWFESGNMHFTAVNTAFNAVTVSIPFTPQGQWPHNSDAWVFFGLTYSNGILKAYIDGVLLGTNSAGSPHPAITNTYGYSIGRRDVRNWDGTTIAHQYMYGLLDQIGLYNRTLSDAEMAGFRNQVLAPANIQYIRD
ncbi:MAG: LamG-like jellyroll fold domain-containing protein [Candidatus Cloacimonadaceae bacterium]|nr:LamG-like jellyroll fold domain-containing protein [Candidatus Cloacimonadaceae bacterium]